MKTNHVLTLFLILSLSVLLNSCTKVSTELTTIEFVILNPANKLPYIGVPVRIFEEKSKNKDTVSNNILEGVTDENGRCKFEFHAKKGNDFWYKPAIDVSYFGFDGDGVDFSYLVRPEVSSNAMKKDQYNEARYEITYYAYLKQITKNTHCEGATDTLVYHASTPSFPYVASGSYDYTKIGLGCYDFVSTGVIEGKLPGYSRVYMGWQKIEWKCNRPSGVTQGTDSIWIDAKSYGTIELLY